MKYNDKVYDAMRPVYIGFLNDKNDRNELINMVDSYEQYELFDDLCEWYGFPTHAVKFVYETIYGKQE